MGESGNRCLWGIKMWADNASKIDMLSYEPYAELIFEIAISERMNPVTIGLLGNWGSGKSTILNLIENKINSCSDKGNIVSIFVNAWMFEGYDDAKTALMEVILRAIEENKSISQNLGDKFKKLRDRVDWIRLGGLVLKGIPMMLSLSMGNPLPLLLEGIKEINWKDEKELEKLQNAILKTKDLIKESGQDNVVENIRKFREEFEQLISDSKIDNLIIIIDDLDRCNPDRIVETLEAIKLFLSVKKTTFIIAMDEDVIRYSIKRKYPHIEKDDIDISKDYLEKIIQLPIRIPELSDLEVKNYMLLLICEMFLKESKLDELLTKLKEKNIFVKGEIINQNDILSILDLEKQSEWDCFKNNMKREDFELQLDVFSRISDIIATTLKGNPRQAKRFLNTFYVRKKLSEIQKLNLDLSLLAKLMVLEYINIDLFRELYKWQLENDGYALALQEIEEEVLKEESGDNQHDNEIIQNSPWLKPIIKQWIRVEPTNLYNYDLRQYFYLAKESIKEKNISSLNLTLEERKWVNELCSEELNDTFLEKKVEEFKANNEIDHPKVVKGIIAKYQHDRRKKLRVLIFLYKHFPDLRKTLEEEIKKMKNNEVTLPEITRIITLKSVNAEGYQAIKKHFLEEKKISKKLWEQIESSFSKSKKG